MSASHIRQRPQGRLAVDVDVAAARINLVGSLDRRTSRHLLDAVRTLGVVHQTRWILDVSAMADCDDVGLRILGACYRAALRRGTTLTIIGASNRLRTALSRLRLDQHVTWPTTDAVNTGNQAARTYPLVKLSA